jgi:FG-GAP repeat
MSRQHFARALQSFSPVLSVLIALGAASPCAVAHNVGSLPSIVHAPADSALDATPPAFARDAAASIARDPLNLETAAGAGQKLTAINGAQGDFFGFSVALDGNTALVGAYGVTIGNHEQQGAAYVFTLADGIWTQVATLTADDGRAGDIFGSEVALSGSVAAIGAYQSNGTLGAVYAFVGVGSHWAQQAKLVADDGASGDALGWSVATSGSTIIAGAPFAVVDGLQRGAVYAFAPDGANWHQIQKLTASDGELGDFFGDAVAIDGSTVIVGADSVNVGDNVVQGAAYVFDGSSGGLAETGKLIANDGAAYDNFGRSVAVSGSTVIVGAPYAIARTDPFEGVAYVFEPSGGEWRQTQKLAASDPTDNGYFGWSVAISGSNALIGASSFDDADEGRAYAFTHANGPWTQMHEFTSGDGTGVDFFGWSVAVSGTNAFIGEPLAQIDDQFDEGAAYFFAGATDSIFANGFE